MQREPALSPPIFEAAGPIVELVMPVAACALHDRVVPLVGLLAQAWNLPARLVHVTPPNAPPDVDLDDLLANIRSWYPDLQARAEHLSGDDPAEAIAAHIGPTALTVMSTDHIDAWPGPGSVAESVVERAGLPVLLVGSHVTKAGLWNRQLDGDIVVGVDGSATAESGVDAAVALARALGHRLWLIQIVPPPEIGEHRPRPAGYLQRLAERHSEEIGTRWEVIQSDDAVAAIEDFASRRDASFLVVGTHGRLSTQRRTIASFASDLAGRSQRPVLVLKVPDVPAIEAG